MTTIAVVLVAIVAISLLALAWAALRNPVLFKLGLRNIPRRRSQTLLIVFGLMVSTMIITAAFTVGDSLSVSIDKTAYDKLGALDLLVRTQRSAGAEPTAGDPYIPSVAVQTIEQQLGAPPQLLTWIPAINEPAPAQNPAAKLTEPSVNLMGLDPEAIRKLGGLPNTAGRRVQITDLGANEAFINATAADKLNAKPGDTVVVLFNNQPLRFTVKDVLRD